MIMVLLPHYFLHVNDCMGSIELAHLDNFVT